MIHKNVETDFSPQAVYPKIDPTAFIHPLAAAIGNVIIGKHVMVSPFASVRGDEGQPIFIGDDSNVQDGVVLHALETEQDGKPIEKNLMEVDGGKYAVYVGKRVSMAHQAQVHGPSCVGDDSFIGMQVLLLKSRVGSGCVIEQGCILIGVTIPDGRYVPAGTTLNNQADADALPEITADYGFKDLNKGVVHVNVELAKGYKAAGLEQA